MNRTGDAFTVILELADVDALVALVGVYRPVFLISTAGEAQSSGAGFMHEFFKGVVRVACHSAILLFTIAFHHGTD